MYKKKSLNIINLTRFSLVLVLIIGLSGILRIYKIYNISYALSFDSNRTFSDSSIIQVQSKENHFNNLDSLDKNGNTGPAFEVIQGIPPQRNIPIDSNGTYSDSSNIGVQPKENNFNNLDSLNKNSNTGPAFEVIQGIPPQRNESVDSIKIKEQPPAPQDTSVQKAKENKKKD
jgi:hypothetical protein